MAVNPIKNILFIRKYPGYVERTRHPIKQLQSIISNKGATAFYAGHEITFLFPGYGKKQKIPHPDIIKNLNTGVITDIVDIGAGGALDPTLKRGDLILSTEDIPIDTLQPLKLRRRKEIRQIVQILSNKKQRRFFERKILTSEKVIGSKEERISLYEKTQCSLVQMEHCWFARALQDVMEPQSFSELYFTHIEIVADVVQQNDTFLNNLFELFHAINYCILRNQHYIGEIKSEFLRLWLENGENRTK